MHYASENMFERFWRIKFFDVPTQQLAVPTFQIKATQAAGTSPWDEIVYVSKGKIVLG